MRRNAFFTGFFTIIAASFLLAGCAANKTADKQYRPLTSKQLAHKIDEQAAWNKVTQMAATECPTEKLPPARGEAVAHTDCMTALVLAHVAPVALFPDLVRESRAEARDLAVKYAKGEVAPADYKTLSIARLEKYKTDWLDRAALRTQTAAAPRKTDRRS